MKKYLIVIAGMLATFAHSQKAVDRIGIKGPLKFDNTVFNLSWSDKPSQTYYIQEYIPAGEKSDSFRHMLTYHAFAVEITPEEAVKSKIKELDQRKKTDSICSYNVSASADGGEYTVDFLLSENKDKKLDIVEFNVYHFKQIDMNSGKGILVYAYSRREYGDAALAFLKQMKVGGAKKELVKQMTAAKLPGKITTGN